jgi:hypothetical protein
MGLIQLNDGLLVEAETVGATVNAASGASRVERGMEQLVPILKKVCEPVASVWRELNRDLSIQEAEIEIGLNFEAEGDIFIAKSTAGATLAIRLKLAPAKEPEGG